MLLEPPDAKSYQKNLINYIGVSIEKPVNEKITFTIGFLQFTSNLEIVQTTKPFLMYMISNGWIKIKSTSICSRFVFYDYSKDKMNLTRKWGKV